MTLTLTRSRQSIIETCFILGEVDNKQDCVSSGKKYIQKSFDICDEGQVSRSRSAIGLIFQKALRFILRRVVRVTLVNWYIVTSHFT